jgi:hypothetical protein
MLNNSETTNTNETLLLQNKKQTSAGNCKGLDENISFGK